MKNTTAIIDLIYPEVEKSLDKNTPAYKKYLSKFIKSSWQTWIDMLSYNQREALQLLNDVWVSFITRC